MAPTQNLVKVSIFLTRKESVSEADFHQYWTERHSKVVGEWLKRHGVVKFTQFHTPSSSQRKAQENIKIIPESRYASYDGVVEILMPNEKCFQNARDGRPESTDQTLVASSFQLTCFSGADPYYENVVKADEDQFIDVSKSVVLFGWEEIYIEEGKIVN